MPGAEKLIIIDLPICAREPCGLWRAAAARLSDAPPDCHQTRESDLLLLARYWKQAGADALWIHAGDADAESADLASQMARTIADARLIEVLGRSQPAPEWLTVEDDLNALFARLEQQPKTDALVWKDPFPIGKRPVFVLKTYLALRGLAVSPDASGTDYSSFSAPWTDRSDRADSLWQKLRQDSLGLVPAVIVDQSTGGVLMLAYVDLEALRRSLRTGLMHYYSRSRKELWLKGAQSGHFQQIRHIQVDCDGDTLLVTVRQIGTACHTGHASCFYRELDELIIDIP